MCVDDLSFQLLFCFTVFGLTNAADGVRGCGAFCAMLPRLMSYMGRRGRVHQPPERGRPATETRTQVIPQTESRVEVETKEGPIPTAPVKDDITLPLEYRQPPALAFHPA